MKITCKLPVACKYWDPEKNRCLLGYKKLDASHPECQKHIQLVRKYYIDSFKRQRLGLPRHTLQSS